MLPFAVFFGAALLVNRLVEIKRREEEARRQSDAQYRTIADTTPDAIITIDGNAQILFVNPAANMFRNREVAGVNYAYLAFPG